MSEAHANSTTLVDRADWDAVLRQLRADGFSPADSIKVTRAVLHVTLGEAKAIVHESSAWADARDGFDGLHDGAERVARQL